MVFLFQVPGLFQQRWCTHRNMLFQYQQLAVMLGAGGLAEADLAVEDDLVVSLILYRQFQFPETVMEIAQAGASQRVA
ncbi:hypothetical protein [Aliamphritea spongicola]|nr:hypothetical protein [Aliamphritea spongicola]